MAGEALSPGGETDLRRLLVALSPQLDSRHFTFETDEDFTADEATFAVIREDEGVTVVRADSHGEWAKITLTVHSSLDAVGMTAAVAAALTQRGISANIIAARFHDHLFVPWNRRGGAGSAPVLGGGVAPRADKLSGPKRVSLARTITLSTYRATADRPDKAKAIAAVAAVHVALAAIILAGLNVGMVSQAVERLKTFDIVEPPPRPPVPPPPAPKPQKAKQVAGAPARKTETTPVVAPQPRIPVISPIPAARIAGVGSASISGAGTSGAGTGAGGSGNGQGGGGSDYSRFTPARLIRNLMRSDYRQLASRRLPAGSAMVALRVDSRGLPTNCRVVRSSGDAAVDSGLCPLIVDRLLFRPALDDQGRPIPYQLQYVATWRL